MIYSKLKAFARKFLNKIFQPAEDRLSHQLRVSLEESNRLIERNIDNSIRQYLAPLMSSLISNEFTNINLLVERMAKLYHPVFLNSFSDNDPENYQQKIIEFLKKLSITCLDGKKDFFVVGNRKYVYIQEESLLGIHAFLDNRFAESPEGKEWVINDSLDVLELSKRLMQSFEDHCCGVLAVNSDLLSAMLRDYQISDQYPSQIILVIERMERISSLSFLQALNDAVDSLKSKYVIQHISTSNLDGIVSVYNFPLPRTLKVSLIRSDVVSITGVSEEILLFDDRDDLVAPRIFLTLPSMQ
jgi:hypothetical protein